MKTTFLVAPCGTSILRSATCWKAVSEYRKKIGLNRTDYSLENLMEVETVRDQVVKKLMKNTDSVQDQFDVDTWQYGPRQDLSAELASLFYIDQEIFQPDETIANYELLFIHGDDEEGRLSATMNEGILNQLLLPDDQKQYFLPKLIQSQWLEVQGLDPCNPIGFDNALWKMTSLLEEKLAKASDPQVYFNLTGGYKGTLLHFVHYLLKDITKPDWYRETYYLFEDSTMLCKPLSTSERMIQTTSGEAKKSHLTSRARKVSDLS